MRILIKNGTIVNEGNSFKGCLFINDGIIEDVVKGDFYGDESSFEKVVDATGLHVLPGVIDDQVHFREPGATHKGCIASESAAAALGGVTSYMDMPNNNPPACTLDALENKYSIAQRDSVVNYSFYLGANNENVSEIRSMDPSGICGVKVFMGSSTGNMLVDSPEALESIFRDAPCLIATHCEEESIIRANLARAVDRYGDNIPFSMHPVIRSEEACVSSTKKAINLARRFGSKLHILHVSTAAEVELISNAAADGVDVTGEICVHYLNFCDRDYEEYGSHIKCNPAIKRYEDMVALRDAVKSGVIRVVATDHAPHLLREKDLPYRQSASGIPLVQHSLQLMLELASKGIFTVEEVVDRMSHSPARRFGISGRGFLSKGTYADIVLVNLNKTCDVVPASRCGWSPFSSFSSSIIHTFCNGVQVVQNGRLTGEKGGERLVIG